LIDLPSSGRPSLLIHGDAHTVALGLDPAERFDLVYLDPPYGVGVTMTARTAPGEGRGAKHAASGPRAYDDSADVGALVAMVQSCLEPVRVRMHDHATLVLHLDHRAVHEAKLACDGVFGRNAFLGEIVWAPGNGAKGRGLSVTHQTLLLYARGPSERKLARWNADAPELREPYATTSLAMHFRQIDEDGRRYRERVVGGKAYRYYADRGRKLGSVWTDIPAMVANSPLRAEATGYPTQKPERLLERLVVATTSPGETVADLMCGSGTTLVAAASLGRRFVGGDASPLAVETAERRLRTRCIPFERRALESASLEPAPRVPARLEPS
jgi:site-specific DNA-methyltransferase (adenine-specific)